MDVKIIIIIIIEGLLDLDNQVEDLFEFDNLQYLDYYMEIDSPDIDLMEDLVDNYFDIVDLEDNIVEVV